MIIYAILAFVSLEASLKLKEISYIQAEGFASGELKHGTIALIEENTPIIALISDKNLNHNTRSNIQEVKARGGKVLIISMQNSSQDSDDFVFDNIHDYLTAIAMVVPTQLIAYYETINRQLNVDMPRNLAKSVTVE